MKQRITEEQYNELNDKQKYTWYKAMLDAGHHMIVPNYDDGMLMLEGFPSIGEMIEFLDINIIYLENEAGYWGVKTTEDLQDIEPVPELCDALWEAVKEVLNKHENK